LAEDIVQDAFVKAYQKLSSFEGRSSFKSWLFQIAVNTAKNKLRSQRDMVSIDQIQMGTIAADGLEKRGLQEMIRDFVEELPEKQKLALTLRVYDDLSFKEIADIMDCPYDTAKANYRHGLMNIKKSLERKNMMDQVRQNSEDTFTTEIEMSPLRAEGEI
jgi:RNA polymerase sigma-70 factor (ECF subfamily)